MKPKFKKLTSYSASAAAFLLLANEGNTQVVYQNIDPDIVLSGDDGYDLDLNADGIIDIHFEANFHDSYFITTSETQSFVINNFDAVINDSDYLEIYGAKNLSLYSTIGVTGSWNSGDEIILNYCHRELYDDIVITFNSIYSNWNAEDQYLGLRFQIDGNTHYGWVRLSLQDFYTEYPGLPKLVIQDFAFESSPETTIEIKSEAASIATELKLIDAGESATPEDLKLLFTKAENETSVSAYKIYLYKNIYLGTIPTIDSLESLPADRFTEIIPTGGDIEYSFNGATLDIDGDPISVGTGEDYIAIVISEPDGILSNTNNISLRSNSQSIFIRSAYPVNWPYLSDPGNNCNTGDFVLEFTSGNIESGIAEYRTFLITNYGEQEIPYLLSLDTNYYVSTIPGGPGDYTITFPPDKLFVDGEGPFLYELYYPNVVSIADSIYATNASIKSGLGTFFYYSPYPQSPAVTLEGISGTPADFKVQFNKIESESYLTEYRLYLVPEDSLDNFTPEFALPLDDRTYTRLFPIGSDINNFFDASTLDCYSNGMEPGTVYRVFVGMVHLGLPELISLSYPSEPITVYTDIETNNSIITLVCIDNIVTITNLQNNLQISIFNVMGQKLFGKKSNTTNEIIDLNYLSAGIYLVVVNSNEKRVVKKITIMH